LLPSAQLLSIHRILVWRESVPPVDDGASAPNLVWLFGR